MITEELLSYITRQLKSGTSRDVIISKLIGAGWNFEDVKDGFSKVDIYHEPLFDEKEEPVNRIEINKNVEKKFKPVQIESVKVTTQVEPKATTEAAIVLDTKELPKGEPEEIIKKEEVTLSSNPDLSKVWVPKSIPVKEKASIENNIKTDIKEKEPVTPVSKTIIDSFNHVDNSESFLNNLPPKENTEIPSSQKDVSKIAMLSSYQNDMRSLRGEKEKVVTPKKRKKSGFLIFILILVIIGAGLYFAYSKGFIKLSNIKVLNTVVPKDPKTILLESSDKLSSLKSYKTETNIDISSLALRDIPSGILKGELLASSTKDTLNLNILGLINNDGENIISDNFITAKGTFIPDYVTTDIKRNGTDLFVSFPDLKQFEGKFAPEQAIVKVGKDEVTFLYSLVREETEKRLGLVDLYRLISDCIASHVDIRVLDSYKNLLSDVSFEDKGEEIVKGINTHHYGLSTDSQSLKDLFAVVSKNFTSMNLPDDKQLELNEIIKIANISSLDVWVGADNNIYQYSINLTFPLASVLKIDNQENTGGDVSISWKTTFYDFNVQNNIFIPTEFKTLDSFVKETKKIKIKNEMVSFQKESLDLFAKEKTYGVKVSTSGSCENLNEGTIFLNILNDIGSKGVCHSSTSGWSMSVPMLDDYGTGLPASSLDKNTTYFCVDSTGIKEEVTTLPKGVSCGVKPKVVEEKIPQTEVETTTTTNNL